MSELLNRKQGQTPNETRSRPGLDGSFSLLRIDGLLVHTCSACSTWFGVPLKAGSGAGNLHYLCPACLCPMLHEGVFFPLGLLVSGEESPLLIAGAAHKGAEILRKEVEISVCPFCEATFFSDCRKRARGLPGALLRRRSPRFCPDCAMRIE